MKKLLLFLTLLPVLAFSQTTWTQTGNTLQRRIVNSQPEYRFYLGSPGYFNLSEEFAKYLSQASADTRYKAIGYVPTWTEITGKPTIPTNNNQLTNGAGYITGYTETDPNVGAHIKAITTTNISNWNTAFGWGNHAGLYKAIGYVPAWTEITGKPTFATVATSGSYTDLINKPTIPTNNNQLTNGAGYITGYTETDPISLHLSGGTISGDVDVNGTLTGNNVHADEAIYSHVATPQDADFAGARLQLDNALGSQNKGAAIQLNASGDLSLRSFVSTGGTSGFWDEAIKIEVDDRSVWTKSLKIGSVATTSGNSKALVLNASTGQVEQQTINTLAVQSGSYIPTVTIGTNTSDGSAVGYSNWIKVGGVVFVTGTINVTTSSSSTAGSYISLPTSTNFANLRDASGTATQAFSTTLAPSLTAEITGGANRVLINYVITSGNSSNISYSFSYVEQFL